MRTFNSVSSSWLDRTEPFSRTFGLDRGSAIDRKFVEKFLAENRHFIKGSVLEVGDDQYSRKFGSSLERVVVLAGQGRDRRSESYFGDLTDPATFIRLGRFDCLIATNVLNFIFDFKAAVRGLALLVKNKSGVCFVTVAGVVSISRFDYDRWGDYWRFNDMSIRKIFEEYFEHVEVRPYGNAPLAAAFVMGLSQEDVPPRLFEHNDPDYQILISVKAWSPKKRS